MRREYPTRLLPNQIYKENIFDGDTTFNNYFVLRNTEGNIPIRDLNEIQSNLGDHIIDRRYQGGLSMNLVGVYHRNDSRYVIDFTKNVHLKKDWNHNEIVLCPHGCLLKYKKNAGCFGFLISDILKIKKTHPLSKKGVEVGKYEISFVIEHKPTCCNYWHVEFHLYGTSIDGKKPSGKLIDLANNGVISKKQLETIGGKMTQELRSLLKIRSKIIHYHISEKHYIE